MNVSAFGEGIFPLYCLVVQGALSDIRSTASEVTRTCQVLVNMEPYLVRGDTFRVGPVCMRRGYR